MNYYLDTDICIYALKGKFPAIKDQLRLLSPNHIKIASIVKAALWLGVCHSSDPKRTGLAVEQFLEPFEVVPFDGSCAMVYSKIRWELEKKGHSIDPNDLLIAATVLTHNGTLITHNTKEYNRVSHLKIQDWI